MGWFWGNEVSLLACLLVAGISTRSVVERIVGGSEYMF
jgi:hypothetical protein